MREISYERNSDWQPGQQAGRIYQIGSNGEIRQLQLGNAALSRLGFKNSM
jgi:hypothetical protein